MSEQKALLRLNDLNPNDPEERAWALLAFGPYTFPAGYNPELAAMGAYSKAQRERSDQAIEAWDRENPYECSPELTAFRKLRQIGIFTDQTFYLPSKAHDGEYTQRLKTYLESLKARNGSSEMGQRKSGSNSKGSQRVAAIPGSTGRRPRKKQRKAV